MSLRDNPLMAFTALPRFEDIQPEHAEPAIRAVLERAEGDLTQLESNVAPTWDGLMASAYRISQPLDFAWGLICHYMAVLHSPAWRGAHEKLQPDVVAFSLRMSQSDILFNAMKTMRHSNAYATLTGPRKRILDSAIRAAELSGVGLGDESKTRFNTIKTRLASLSTLFTNHVLDARKSFHLTLRDTTEVAGLPQTLLKLMAEAQQADGQETSDPEHGPWKLTLDLPVLVPFMKYSERRDLREKLYRAHVTLASNGEFDNGPVIDEILALRSEMARLLGYQHYAEVSLATKMAQNVSAVDDLLETLRSAAYPRAMQDRNELRDFAQRQGCDEDLMHWDFSFWQERLRESRFDFTDETLRPYFQFPRVLQGLFQLIEKRFGVTIKNADGETQVWHPDVRFFHVHDGNGNSLASFYLDPYSRPGTKQSGAWMAPVLPRDTTVQPNRLPLVYLVCNQTPPSRSQPSLMTLREVETLFHEFGHGLQHMLTTVGEPGASGLNNIEWDAVELASQFMENWCYDYATLKGLTQHIDTGKSIPRSLFDKMTQARTFHSGSETLRQLALSMLDIELHARFTQGAGRSTQDVVDRVNASTRIIPPLPEDRTLCAFSHIFAGGYAAGYYSYKWSAVLSADAFAAFEEAQVLGEEALAETGRRYRETILALGGGTHPADVFRLFRGRDPDPKALLRRDHLLDDPGPQVA